MERMQDDRQRLATRCAWPGRRARRRPMRLGAIWLPLSAVALIGAGCGAAQRDGGAWRPYQPAPAQPGQAWAEAQRAGDRQRAVNRGASTAATADSDRGDDAPAAQPSRPEPVSTTASRPERRSSAKRAPAAAEKASPRRVAAVERDTTGGSGGGAARAARADATPPGKTRQACADADAGPEE